MLGLSTTTLVILFTFLAILLLLIFVFICKFLFTFLVMGIMAFGMGGKFEAVNNSLMPCGAEAAIGKKKRNRILKNCIKNWKEPLLRLNPLYKLKNDIKHL